jgi:phage tail-like protein
MTTAREDRPYMQFNFLVEFEGLQGGFQEVSGIGTEVAVSEYRHGNDPENNVRKMTGLNKVADITLKRGVMGTKALFDLLDAVRTGKAGNGKSMKIMLMNEDRTISAPVMTWQLKNVRATKLTYGPLNAKGGDVAMEEAVFAYERLELE